MKISPKFLNLILILPTLALNLILTLTPTLIPNPKNFYQFLLKTSNMNIKKLWKIIMKPRKISENGTRAWNNRFFYLFLKKTDSKSRLKNL